VSAASTISSTGDVIAVLPQHRFDEAALERYMTRHVEGFVPPLAVALNWSSEISMTQLP